MGDSIINHFIVYTYIFISFVLIEGLDKRKSKINAKELINCLSESKYNKKFYIPPFTPHAPCPLLIFSEILITFYYIKFKFLPPGDSIFKALLC